MPFSGSSFAGAPTRWRASPISAALLPRFCLRTKEGDYEGLDYFRHLIGQVDVARFDYAEANWNLSDEMEKAKTSLMPEGLLKDLNDQQVRDLFAYLRMSQPLIDK